MTSGDAVDGATRGQARAPEPEGFSDALRTAIASSGRSLESLRRRLAERGTPVSIATLSYWQSGRSQPQRGSSLRAVLHLEELLQLPHGHLLDRIGPRRRPFLPQREVTAVGLPVDHPDAELALADLGFGANPGLVDVTIHDTLDVDDQGVERVRTIRNVVRAVQAGRAAPARPADDRRAERGAGRVRARERLHDSGGRCLARRWASSPPSWCSTDPCGSGRRPRPSTAS